MSVVDVAALVEEARCRAYGIEATDIDPPGMSTGELFYHLAAALASQARDLDAARDSRDEFKAALVAEEERHMETAREMDDLRGDIDEHLPAYALDDGTGDEANHRERIEYAGAEIKRLRQDLTHARKALRRSEGSPEWAAAWVWLDSHPDAAIKSVADTNGRLEAERDAAREEAGRLRQEREEARDWVRRMTAETRVLTCAFCGEAYPPGTPETNHERLTAHVAVCAKHPARAIEKEAQQWREAFERSQDDVATLRADVKHLRLVVEDRERHRRAAWAFVEEMEAAAREALDIPRNPDPDIHMEPGDIRAAGERLRARLAEVDRERDEARVEIDIMRRTTERLLADRDERFATGERERDAAPARAEKVTGAAKALRDAVERVFPVASSVLSNELDALDEALAVSRG